MSVKVDFATKHFSLREFVASETAEAKRIDNSPPPAVARKLMATMAGMQRVRWYLGFPCKIHSGFRCTELNDLVGGAKDSQHLRGQAADFTCPAFGGPREIAARLETAMRPLGIDQLILEATWVHVSFTFRPRYEILTLVDGKYLTGLV